MPTSAQTPGLLTPQQLEKLAQETAFAERQRKAVEEKQGEERKAALRKAFMERELRPDILEYLMTAVKQQAEQGKHELLVLQFPSELLSDGGRRVNSFEPDWPESLQGFSKRAYAYFQEHLRPAGYRLRAQILDFPHGNLGDVGLFLCW
jgi:hypothetical protein